MAIEQRDSIVCIFVNLIITFMEILGGMMFGSYTLMCNGYYTLCNLIEHYITHIAGSIRGRKENMKTPFGIGKFEYISSGLIGLLFFSIAIYICIKSYYLTFKIPNIKLYYLLLGIIILKYIGMQYGYKMGKKNSSELVMEVSKNTYKDLFITLIPLIIISLCFYNEFLDLIGCVLISLIIFYKGFSIMHYNYIMYKGQNDTSLSTNKKIDKILKNYKDITCLDKSLLNVNNYYLLTLTIKIKEDMNIFKLMYLERKISRNIRYSKINIKSVDFDEYLK